MESVAVVDCAGLMPLCRGRCCRLPVFVSDADSARGLCADRVHLRQLDKRADGFCVHSNEGTRACDAYEVRPAVCRRYDCRNDPHIWADFAKKIPAAWDYESPRPLLGLVMMVRDQAASIRAELDALLERYPIAYWTIVDCGSVDDTPRIVREVLHRLPGDLHHEKDATPARAYALHGRRTEFVLPASELPGGYPTAAPSLPLQRDAFALE